MRPQARRKARSLALQAVYQWALSSSSMSIVKDQFKDKINPKKVDIEYFNVLVDGVAKNIDAIDEVITPFLDRKITELDEVELSILRIAVYEFMDLFDVPYKVVINEALELTKIFGSVEGYKYVNGILDKAANFLRATEM